MPIWLRFKELISSILSHLSHKKNTVPFEELLPYERPLQNHRILIQFKGERETKEYTVQEFERLMETTYARHLFFPSKKSYLSIKELCKTLFSAGLISKRAEWLGVVFRNQIDTGSVANASIRFVDDHVGFGLFAEESIQKGEMIGEYTGLVRRCFPIISLPNSFCFRYPLYHLFFGSYTIDAEKYTNEVSFINHSKNNPNCESVVSINHHLLHVIIRAARDIEKGEELSFDYGPPIEELV